MATVTIELRSDASQTQFNIRRWNELLADTELARFEGRIETDRHGQIIMTPPPAPAHGSYQARIAHLLQELFPKGRVLTECPISTADGVKAADVAWASPERMRELGNHHCFPHAPEICVEVLSPGNTEREIQEKIALYFDAGAGEVWLCDASGHMQFIRPGSKSPGNKSQLCPAFPLTITLV